jgi:DNA repair protein RadC
VHSARRVKAEPTVVLVARLLRGSRERRLTLANGLLAHAGSLARLRRLPLSELAAAGLTGVEARRVAAALELGIRAFLDRPRPRSLKEPRDVYRCVSGELLACERERFVVVSLDVRNRPLSIVRVAEGAVDACPVDLREVFVAAVRERASGIVVAHNHPSGDPTPSPEDMALTERLRLAGDLLNIPLLDHLIVGGPGHWVSLVQAGLLRGPAR